MNEEARRLVEAYRDAMDGWAFMEKADADVDAAQDALTTYIERIERERCTCDEEAGIHDPMCVLAVRETARTMQARIAALEAENARLREAKWHRVEDSDIQGPEPIL